MFISDALAQEQTTTSPAIAVPLADAAVAPATAGATSTGTAMSSDIVVTPSADQQPSAIAGVMPFIIMGLAFYFLLLRPQQKRINQHNKMISTISRGDKVITTGGLIGKVNKVDATGIIHVDIADGVTVQVVADGIASVSDKHGQPKNADNKAANKDSKEATAKESAAVAKTVKKAKVANDN